MRSVFILAAGFLAAAMAATPLAARDLSPTEEARLQDGEVLVEVTPDREGSDRVWAAEDIAAPPDTVWAVMTECDEALRYVPRLKTCEVVQADPAGRWDVRSQRLSSVLFLPDVKVVFHLDYDRPRSMRFYQVSGDMTGTAGEWRLVPLPGGRGTRVFYDARLGVPDGVPGPFARALMRSDAPAAMRGLRARSLERAQATSRGRPERGAPALKSRLSSTRTSPTRPAAELFSVGYIR